eukprot:342841_1
MSACLNNKGLSLVMILIQFMDTLIMKQALYQDGLATRKIFKNLMVAPDLQNGYEEQVLPFIAYSIKFEGDNKELMENAYNVTASAFEDAADHLDIVSRSCVHF